MERGCFNNSLSVISRDFVHISFDKDDKVE